MDDNHGISAEWLDWYALSPQERWEQSGKLWSVFLELGGSLEPEPDPDSPFYDAEASHLLPAHGGASLRVLRRGPV